MTSSVILLLVLTAFAVCPSYAQDPESGCPDGHTGLVPHPMFCPFYYLCNDGVPNLRECPEGLYFNPRVESCDYPDQVPECQGGTRPPTDPVTTTTQKPETDPPETEGTFMTTVSTTSRATTPGPTTTVGTTTTTTTTPRTTTTPPSGGLNCPADPSPIFMPYPGDCSRYYLCQDGAVTRIQNCNAGLWFRFSQQVCMTPWAGTCVG